MFAVLALAREVSVNFYLLELERGPHDILDWVIPATPLLNPARWATKANCTKDRKDHKGFRDKP